MNRKQLEHVIRASADIADDDEIIVVGSQAILGGFPDAPPELLVSNEADVYPRNRPERSDLIDGCIGEGSPFHETYGYYAQGVGEGTAILPVGWQERLVPIRNPNTRGATGWCLELHDLLLSKAVAGRDKDLRFLHEVASHHLARVDRLLELLPSMPIAQDLRDVVRERILYAFRGGI